LSPYRKGGSLEAIFARVQQIDPPAFWTDSGKALLIADLHSGLLYLHSHGIFQADLKPSDLIVDAVGSIAIGDFFAAKLEASKFTVASQVGSLSYSAPEISVSTDATALTAKADVFSFGAILFEISCGQRLFPSTFAPATIWRKVQDSKPGARLVIPSFVHPTLRLCIQRCWVPDPGKRPKLSELWKQFPRCGDQSDFSPRRQLIAGQHFSDSGCPNYLLTHWTLSSINVKRIRSPLRPIAIGLWQNISMTMTFGASTVQLTDVLERRNRPQVSNR
jgi:serine/threonine protein kinase